jgi:hypothetical protein
MVGEVKNIDRTVANGAFKSPGEVHASGMVNPGVPSSHPVSSAMDVGVIVPRDGALYLALAV